MGGEAVIQPLLMKSIFDTVSTSRSFGDFIPLGLGYFALGVIVNSASVLLFNWRTRVDNKIISDVSQDLLLKYYDIPYLDLLKNGSGYYVARIRSDVKDGLVPMLTATRDMIVGAVSFLMLIGVLIYISFSAFLVLVAMIPVFAVASMVIRNKIKAITSSERDMEASLIDVLGKSVAALKMVVGFKLIPPIADTFRLTLDRGLETSFKKSRLIRLLQMAGDITRVISDVSSIFVGAFLVTTGRMTIGSFIAFMNAFWRSSSTLFVVLNKWAEIHSHLSVVERLAAFHNLPRPCNDTSAEPKLIVSDISFSYGDRIALESFSIIAQPGDRIIVVGENGSGKTTLANILAGFLQPSSGSVIRPRRTSSVTLPLSFPPIPTSKMIVDPDLLSDLGLGSVEVRNAKPDDLSSGQQQKLAVAMAISQSADLYILDEPFANLDTMTRDLLLDHILRRTRKGILILIAHDPARYIHHFSHEILIGRTGSPDGLTIRDVTSNSLREGM